MLRPSAKGCGLRRQGRGDRGRRQQDHDRRRGRRLADDLLAHGKQHHGHGTGCDADQGIEDGGGDERKHGAAFGERVVHAFDEMFDRRYAVSDNAATNGEHGRCAKHRQALHEEWRRAQNERTQPAGGRVRLAMQREPQIVELHNAGHQTVHEHGGPDRNDTERDHLLHERRGGQGAQRDHHDLGRQHEVGAHRTLHLVLLEGHQIHRRIGHGLQPFTRLPLVAVMQKLVRELFDAFEAEEQTTDHHQRHDRNRQERADQQRRGHEDELVDERTLGHSPHDRQLTVHAHARHLLRIQGQIVTHHPGRFRGCHLGEHRDVVEQRRNVIDQSEQTGSGHGVRI